MCNEEFIYISSPEDYINKQKKIQSSEESWKQIICLSTPPYRCKNNKCDAAICGVCMEMLNEYNGPYFCEFCRNTDWKDYMSRAVLYELTRKVLGGNEASKYMMNSYYKVNQDDDIYNCFAVCKKNISIKKIFR